MDDVTALNRTIPADKLTPEALTPAARIEYMGWFQSVVSGPQLGGVDDVTAAMWLFTIFTSVLPNQQRIHYRSVLQGAHPYEDLTEMARAGTEIMQALFAGDEKNASEAETPTKKGTRSSKPRSTGSEPA